MTAPALGLVLGVLASLVAQAVLPDRPLFEDTFDAGLSRWTILSPERVRLHDAGAAHGNVMVLEPGADALALITGSDRWGSVRIEGDVAFPTEGSSYFGVAYDAARTGRRWDFGLIYIKSPEGYLQANPHRDFNVGRTLYPEHRADLKDPKALRPGNWNRFRVEVDRGTAHFYLGDFETPLLTFAHFERRSGLIGFQPRSVGEAVWLDNVRVTPLRTLAYRGAPRPAVEYSPGSMQTSWDVIGPLTRTDDRIALRPNTAGQPWRPFPADARGAIVTGRVTDYHGAGTVAYFRTQVHADAAGSRTLHLSTVDDLAVWVNGDFHWFVPRGPAAWFDFGANPSHRGQRIPLPLRQGTNQLVVRVRGGVYASGGFYARIE